MQKLAKEHKCVRCGGDHKVSACKENKPKLERCAFLLGRVFTGVLVNAPGFVCAGCYMFEPVVYEADKDRLEGVSARATVTDTSASASAAIKNTVGSGPRPGPACPVGATSTNQTQSRLCDRPITSER